MEIDFLRYISRYLSRFECCVGNYREKNQIINWQKIRDVSIYIPRMYAVIAELILINCRPRNKTSIVRLFICTLLRDYLYIIDRHAKQRVVKNETF